MRLLPVDGSAREDLLAQYRKKRGYGFLNPGSRYNGYFMRQMGEQGVSMKRRKEGERKIVMEGSFEELSVGGMC